MKMLNPERNTQMHTTLNALRLAWGRFPDCTLFQVLDTAADLIGSQRRTTGERVGEIVTDEEISQVLMDMSKAPEEPPKERMYYEIEDREYKFPFDTDFRRINDDMTLNNYPVRTGLHMYAIRGEDGGPIRFGVSTNVRRRLNDMRSTSPVWLELLGVIPDVTRKDEQAVHRYLDAFRAHSEWFNPSTTVFDLIEDHFVRPELTGMGLIL